MLPKNENVNNEMIEIMETIQEKYVPQTSSGLNTTFFGGDQLTEERSRNVQIARSDGRTTKERLEGVWPKNEDWHAIRIAYDVSITILSDLIFHQFLSFFLFIRGLVIISNEFASDQ